MEQLVNREGDNSGPGAGRQDNLAKSAITFYALSFKTVILDTFYVNLKPQSQVFLHLFQVVNVPVYIYIYCIYSLYISICFSICFTYEKRSFSELRESQNACPKTAQKALITHSKHWPFKIGLTTANTQTHPLVC